MPRLLGLRRQAGHRLLRGQVPVPQPERPDHAAGLLREPTPSCIDTLTLGEDAAATAARRLLRELHGGKCLSHWSPTPVTGAPDARSHHVAVRWTGAQMFVWGGKSGAHGPEPAGGLYDPAKKTWTRHRIRHRRPLRPVGRDGGVGQRCRPRPSSCAGRHRRRAAWPRRLAPASATTPPRTPGLPVSTPGAPESATGPRSWAAKPLGLRHHRSPASICDSGRHRLRRHTNPYGGRPCGSGAVYDAAMDKHRVSPSKGMTGTQSAPTTRTVWDSGLRMTFVFGRPGRRSSR